MVLPNCPSGFPGVCKKCKVKYAKGTQIYKINEEYWCSNENCPGVEAKQAPKTTSSPVDLEAKLDQIWDISFAKAKKIMNETYDEAHMPSDSKKQILIMAQTFTKALCGNGD